MPAALHSVPLYTWAMDKSSNLIWIDLEMTGLDTMGDSIIEIATQWHAMSYSARLNFVARCKLGKVMRRRITLTRSPDRCTSLHARRWSEIGAADCISPA